MKMIARSLFASVFLATVITSPARAQPSKEELKSIQSSLAALRDSNERSDFEHARAMIQQAISNDTSRNRFAQGVLLVKLLIATNQRIDAAKEKSGADEDFTDILAIGAGTGAGTGAGLGTFGLDNTKPAKNSATASAPDPEQVEREQFQKFLRRFDMSISRSLFIFYQKFIRSEDELKRIVERATSDPNTREATYDQLVAEFKSMLIKFDTFSGKLKRE